jgi:hypothetical protein
VGSGTDVKGKGKEFGKQQEEDYTKKYYHRPSDEFDATTWTLAGAIEDLKLIFKVGQALAVAPRLPQWKEGSEFKLIRERSLKVKK